jgi:hypothetical protein
MIDPHNLPAGKMTTYFLEEWILFGIAVAGKPAVQTAAKLDRFLKDLKQDPDILRFPTIRHRLPRVMASPFELVMAANWTGKLEFYVKKHRFGKYGTLLEAYRKVPELQTMGWTNPDLTVEALDAIPGIGMKTARMIMLYYRPDSQIAPLDTHILRFLGELGYKVPKTSPTGRRYLELEKAFIKEARKRKMTPLELDKKVWQASAIR